MRTAEQTIEAFCSQLAAGTPAPGGGAAAAVAGAMGASLVAMVAGLTVGREKYAAVQDEMMHAQEVGNREAAALLRCADEDQEAFDQVMAAFALPKGSEEEKRARTQAVQAGYKAATKAPLATMEHCLTVMRYALGAAEKGNPNALSDAYVGFLTAAAGFEGALWNVAINLGSIKDEAFREEALAQVNRLRAEKSEIERAIHALTPDPVARFLGQK
ncbi:MAG: cyclodeaminase/cyclohydrolase family protein [Bacillota bacterium]